MSKGPQRLVLVVDPDPAAAAALGPALRRDGYQVRIARDGARALQLALARLPDVVLIAEGTPIVAPRTLVRILRSNPRTGSVPLLYAGADPGRIPDGVDAFVRKPVNADEVRAAIRTVAGAGTGVPERVEGSLVQLPLPDVLQMLGNNRRSGRLRITSDAARSDISFHEGEVMDAVTNAVTGEKALFRALALHDGHFAFQPGEWRGVRRIDRPLAELLLDGLRVSDELALVERQLPPRDALVMRTADAGAADAGPLADEVRALLGTPQRLGDLLDRLPGTDVDAGRVLAALHAWGELTVVEPPPRLAPSTVGPLVGQAEAHVLRTRLRPGTGAGAAIGKVLLAGGDMATRRAAIERLSAFEEFRSAGRAGVEFGTLGAFELPDLRIDVVLLPVEPVLAPLWGVLGSNALAALFLGPASAGRDGWPGTLRIPAGWCGPRPRDEESSAPDAGYLGPDVPDALRALVARAAARTRPS